MKYRIEFEEYASQKMAHTYVSGLMTEEERNMAAIETVCQMRENTVHKVIWDIRETELDYSLIGSHEVVLNLAALGVTNDDSIAVIYSHNPEQHKHAKNVAYNRGINNIQYFMVLQDGIDWLIARK